jgi:predicted DNA-binding protein
MTNDTRFEIRMPSQRRHALDQLAHESGLSAADLARLAIGRLLEDRTVRLPAAVQGEAS